MQNEDNQVRETHSILARLDYPNIGVFEHVWLNDEVRSSCVIITDREDSQDSRNCFIQAWAAIGDHVIKFGVLTINPVTNGPTIQRSAKHSSNQARVQGSLIFNYQPDEIENYAQYLAVTDIVSIFPSASNLTEARIEAVINIACSYVYYILPKEMTIAGDLDIAAVTYKLAKILWYMHILVEASLDVNDSYTTIDVAVVVDDIVIGNRLINIINCAVHALRLVQKLETAVVIARKWLAAMYVMLDHSCKSLNPA